MIKIFLILMLTITSVYATNFDGHIVKLKSGSKSITFPESVKGMSSISTSFGKFYHVIASNNSLEQISKNSNVEYIEPNWIIKLDEKLNILENQTTTDAKFSQQWGFKNTGRNIGSRFKRGKAGEDVNALKAWTIQKGSKDIIIAVIDTGIDYKHSDLKDNMWTNQLEKDGVPGVDDDGNGYIDDIHGYDFSNNDGDPMDDYSHGTHCAGNIGASHNGKGTMGMMANVSLMAMKFLSKKGEGTIFQAIKSTNYAMENGAKIMSNSWGMYEFSRTMKLAIQAARDKNILFVASAGNNTSDNDMFEVYPARYNVDNVIAVGAMSGNGKIAKFSNFGKNTVHIFAPGENIMSTMIHNRYKSKSGTSMAAPIVTGALGLLLSNEPNISYKDAKERLIKTSMNSSLYTNLAQGGRLDAYRLLTNEQR